MIGKMFYFKFFPALVLTEICEMSAEEKGRYLSKMCGDLVRGRSEDSFIQGMIDEANNYSNIKRSAGKKGGEAKASKALAKASSAIAEPSTPLASSSSSTVTEDQKTKPKTSGARFTPPTIEEVQSYCQERKNGIDAKYFVDSNTAKGWVIGKSRTPAKDWKAMIRTWEGNNKNQTAPHQQKTTPVPDNYPYKPFSQVDPRLPR